MVGADYQAHVGRPGQSMIESPPASGGVRRRRAFALRNAAHDVATARHSGHRRQQLAIGIGVVVASPARPISCSRAISTPAAAWGVLGAFSVSPA